MLEWTWVQITFTSLTDESYEGFVNKLKDSMLLKCPLNHSWKCDSRARHCVECLLKGLQCILVQFQTWSTILKFTDARESIEQNIHVRKDWILFFWWMVKKQRSLNMYFWKDITSEEITIIDHQHGDRYVVAIMVTKSEFLVTKDEMFSYTGNCIGHNFKPFNSVSMDNNFKGIVQNGLVKCSDIMCDHNVKLTEHI